jgi:autotransporter strand-loop-strand O-heptosyltransferase
MYKIFAHCSYVGNTGYNQHSRDFFRGLSKHQKVKVRNFTIGNSWKGYNETPHDGETYFNETDKELLYQQILWNSDRKRENFSIYPSPDKEFVSDLNIVLCETNHHIFYDEYIGPKIAYNVWESTLQPQGYFNKLLEFDELWVPSKWQRDCTIAQGYPEDKIKVVPEGVDVHTFYPDETVTHPLTKDKFTFFVAGRWDYRKSIKEIIETFVKTFNKNEPVELIISVDNPFSNDGLKTTEERLKHYGLEDDRIKILHFPPREEYISLLKSCNVFVSCARSEGWNLPLIEAMACGTPSIYSDCSGQLEFAKGRGIPVRISHELAVSASTYNHFNENVGNYYEPDFNDLSEKMLLSYEKYDTFKKLALVDSKHIREEFSWGNIAKIGSDTIKDFMERKPWQNKEIKPNKFIVTYLNGPKVEIKGNDDKEYFIEFVDRKTNSVRYSTKIKNNMWASCGIKYYVDWIIKANGAVIDEFTVEGETVLIGLDSKAIGDTIAWVPYSVEFAKQKKCKVIMSTFHNEWFQGLEEYKDITFVSPGSSVGCKSVYNLGWFKKDGKWADHERNPNQVNLIPLQQAATDILGLEFKELNFGLNFPTKKRPINEEYIVFGPNATSGCKEWPYEKWVELSKMLIDLNYKVVTLTKNPYHIENTINVHGTSFDSVANYLNHAKAFIGLGSGLSWFNWALGNHTFMVNGFARPDHEFTSNVTRIYNDNTCIFCWNDEVFTFDPGNWDWCPVYEKTSKQHICQKSITADQVFKTLNL